MNNQEKTVHEYLSGYFGVDLNESIDLLTESDIIDAVQDLNTLVFALNERTASFGSNQKEITTRLPGDDVMGIQSTIRDLYAQQGKEMFSQVGDLANKLKKDFFPAMRRGDLYSPKAANDSMARLTTMRSKKETKDYNKKFIDVTPFERAKNAMKLMDKPDGSFGTHGEKNRKNLKPKFEKEVEQRSRLERAGMDPNREDYDSLDTQLAAHVGIVAQERREDKKRRGVTPSISDYRLPGGGTDYAAMAQDMRESRTLREQVHGGASMYPVIPCRNSTRTPEEQAAYEIRQREANAELARSTAERNRNPDGSQMTPEQKAARSQRIKDERRERMETPENLSRRQAKLEHRDRVRAELTNRSRARKGMGPLGQEQMIGTEANRAASGQTTLQDRYAAAVAKRASFGSKGPLEAPSEDDYMKSGFPGGKYDISKPKGAPKGATTYEKPDGSGFSTIPPVNLGY